MPPTPERLIAAARGRARERVWTRLSGGPDGFARTLRPEPPGASPVTDLLFERLSKESVAAIEAALEPSQRELMSRTDPHDRRRLLLALGARHRVERALAETGLRPQMPPSDVHAMARDDIAAGGSPYYADLVVDALGQSGFELEAGQAVLDFGCSSGRVVRVLAAAFPDVHWHGCDPIEEAIGWAAGNLPGIEFLRSPEDPPLPYGEAQFDVVFAISIWSHFSEPAALSWTTEMARVIRPGGRLAFTAQGCQTVAHQAASGTRPAFQLVDVLRALYRGGFFFAHEFGQAGDHGLRSGDWGTAFLTPEWLLTKLTPAWRVLGFWPGRAEGSQDLYVLERR
jgi:SAM-dependent methyltransferase